MDARGAHSAAKLKALINRLRKAAEGVAAIARNGCRIAQKARAIAAEMVHLWDEKERRDSGEATRAAAREYRKQGTTRLSLRVKSSVVSLENRGVSFSGDVGYGVVDGEA